MGLIDLKTNLKDLKFGKDEYKGGNSGQPFIQTRIPATDEPLQTGVSNAAPVLASLGGTAAIGAIAGSILGNPGAGAAVGAAVGLGIGILGANSTTDGFRLPSAGTGGPDFLVRGGSLLPGRIVNDGIRLTKYFTSVEGILFATKQNLLSRISVRTQSSRGLLNDGAYTPLNTLVQSVGLPFGLHINKQGLNPFDTRTYFDTTDVINNKDSNRLILLTDSKIYNTISANPITTGISLLPTEILTYSGGPGSILGIGKTNIRYATDNFGVSLKITNATSNNTLTSDQLQEISGTGEGNIGDFRYPTVVDFRKKLRLDLNKTLISESPKYSGTDAKNIELRVNLGDPGNKAGKDLSSYVSGSYRGAASINSFDKINASVLYQSEDPQGTDNSKSDATKNDLVKFRIGVINNNTPTLKTYIHFRAFLDQISDNYTSTWDPVRYIGRGENFYTYNGFDRKVLLSWTVAAQSKIELIPMYKKLNYLASVCAPDYSQNGYMRGNIVTLTIGGYFYEQPGIITSLNYEMNSDNETWEIGIDDNGNSDSSVKELPHLIRVTSFNFIPIHQFVPRLQQNTYNTSGDREITKDGFERYIALSTGGHTNYNSSTI